MRWVSGGDKVGQFTGCPHDSGLFDRAGVRRAISIGINSPTNDSFGGDAEEALTEAGRDAHEIVTATYRWANKWFGEGETGE